MEPDLDASDSPNEDDFLNSSPSSEIPRLPPCPVEGLPGTNTTFTHTFLQSIMSSVDSKDPVVATAWMETLLDVIDLLPVHVIHTNILRLAISRGQLSQPVSSRILCCRLLGKLSSKFPPYLVLKEIVPVVQCLCQDLNPEVRACMCRHLGDVAHGIGLEATRGTLLPELVELANDEESSVRMAGVQTIVDMIPLLDKELCTHTMAPLVQKVCDQALSSMDQLVLPVVARELGQLCHCLHGALNAAQHLWFIKFFCKVASLGLSRNSQLSPMPDLVPVMDNYNLYLECRLACAFNMPALAVFAGPSLFPEHLATVFSDLCNDPLPRVRAVMAAGFHEVVKVLNSVGSPLLLRDLVALLKDDSLEVVRGILTENLPKCVETVLSTLSQSDSEIKEAAADLGRALLAAEATLSNSHDWRLHANLLSQLSAFPLPGLHNLLGPFLLGRLVSTRALPCRLAAGYSLLVLTRTAPREELRSHFLDTLKNELGKGKSCHRRMLFVRLCELAMGVFSRKFFKSHFFLPLLSLAEDPVPNIRLRLCTLLAPLKALLRLPQDENLLQELEASVRRLMTVGERDRDVMAALCHAIDELDKIEVPSDLENLTIADIEDRRKEEEENKFVGKVKDSYFKEGHHSLPRPPKVPVLARKKFSTIPRASTDSNKKSGIPVPRKNLESISKSLALLTLQQLPNKKECGNVPRDETSISPQKPRKETLKSSDGPSLQKTAETKSKLPKVLLSEVKLRPSRLTGRSVTPPPPASPSRIPTSSLRRRSLVVNPS